MPITGNVNFNDDTQNFGVIEGTATFNDNSQNEGVVDGNATFTENSENYGSISGNSSFQDSSTNIGVVSGDADFNDNSQNEGVVGGGATFTENSENKGTVSGDSSFQDSSKNGGIINGDADFIETSINEGIVQGDGTFDDNSTNNGVVNNIELNGNANLGIFSSFRTYKNTQVYYPYQKNDGLYYVLNWEGRETLAGYTMLGVFLSGIPELTPKQILPVKFFTIIFDSWHQYGKTLSSKAINFYEKVYDFLQNKTMPPLPIDSGLFDIYNNDVSEWALFMTRMAFIESSYNSNDYDAGGGSYGVFQMGVEQNRVYKVLPNKDSQGNIIYVNGKPTYSDFTPAQLKNDDIQLELVWKAINQNLTASGYERKTGKIVPKTYSSFLNTTDQKLLLAWGQNTPARMMQELSGSTRWFSYENGNKNPPVDAHGCYSNGFYRYGLRDYRSMYEPTVAKDTDDAVLQHAINQDNIT